MCCNVLELHNIDKILLMRHNGFVFDEQVTLKSYVVRYVLRCDRALL